MLIDPYVQTDPDAYWPRSDPICANWPRCLLSQKWFLTQMPPSWPGSHSAMLNVSCHQLVRLQMSHSREEIPVVADPALPRAELPSRRTGPTMTFRPPQIRAVQSHALIAATAHNSAPQRTVEWPTYMVGSYDQRCFSRWNLHYNSPWWPCPSPPCHATLPSLFSGPSVFGRPAWIAIPAPVPTRCRFPSDDGCKKCSVCNVVYHRSDVGYTKNRNDAGLG